ncbi:hypothetical protein [Mucilaginibacter aquatilis]|uniref:Uncharacterized protein n=1 Tax=Mucilaginibacter aquatilis TaxID=1517760 RepID=A0A6I4IB33_9SPHI|nr:hypothetical protein [Mucilaginibacter aquatilis]MVN92401.1 hypothetical protein [Mucilaginibacter aquatilis]
MDTLRGSSIRISIDNASSPKNKHLSGTVIYERHGNKLIVKLSETLQSGEMRSDMMLLTPQFKKERFVFDTPKTEIMINGTLISEDDEHQQPGISGILSLN